MATNKLITLYIGLFFGCACSAYDFKNASEYTLFQNYALSACVASHYPEGPIYQDAIDALNGNRAVASIALEAYAEVNKALEKWSKKQYISQAGNRSAFFMCMDFYNSDDVLTIYQTFNPCQGDHSCPSKNEYQLRCRAD